MSGVEIGEVLFEFRQVGGTVKVTAIHVATGTEAVLVGAVNAGEYALKMAAIRKLAYVLNRAVGGTG